MDLNQRIEAFSKLGDKIRFELRNFNPLSNSEESDMWLLARRVYQKNPWFTPESTFKSLTAIAGWLNKEDLTGWTSNCTFVEKEPLRVGVIMAGNIPLVGFHDFLTVLMSGNSIDIKCSSDDDILLPAVIDWLIEIEPGFRERIRLVTRLEHPEAVIATGSNNSSRYFEYYFGKYPHIIRKNRNSVAVIDGNETKEELTKLGADIFSYFGLGCRNVSKIYIPSGYVLDKLFESLTDYAPLMNHNKYMNNFDYHSALFLLNNAPFLTNNFLILREHDAMATPVSVVHYEYYTTFGELSKKLQNQEAEIQCIVGHNYIPFGKSQEPELMDYADGVDVMKFLLNI